MGLINSIKCFFSGHTWAKSQWVRVLREKRIWVGYKPQNNDTDEEVVDSWYEYEKRQTCGQCDSFRVTDNRRRGDRKPARFVRE